jgi:ABC-type sugar transport system ATPase subunit
MKNIEKKYSKKDSTIAVENVSLSINEGEFIVLLGPSGCGKTTILRMLAGLEELTSGEIWFGDQLMNHEPPEARSVGMVFQSYALYPHMTVFDNLAFGLKARGMSKPLIKQSVHEMVELLGLSSVINHRPKELSGGQRQRVALGRALVRDPAVFLMDEPLSNLDANLREQMRLELARIHKRVKVTTVYVTHDQNEALTLADRVVVMEGGRVRQVGTPEEIYGSPANTFIAGFVGSPGMNLWTLEWKLVGDSILMGEGAIELPRSFLPVLESAGSKVTVGIRPEYLGLSLVHADVKVKCKVELLENLGSHSQLHAHLINETPVSLIARLEPNTYVDPDEEIVLTTSTGAVHLFDAVTGERIDLLGEDYIENENRFTLS